jgi:UDPglucose--hexose-1-phosphate uridylyltransferase
VRHSSERALSDLFRQPHRRFNPLTDEWVLVSPGRTNRPWLGAQETQANDRPAFDPGCCLCPGNTRASGAANPAYTDAFVFTNDFPALRPDASADTFEAGFLRAEGEIGTCRVVCFSPRHDLTLALLPNPAMRRVIDTWADESDALGRRFRWVQVFENRGAAMGASNPHPHAQIWAGTHSPNQADREGAAQRRHSEASGRRLLLDYAEQEVEGPRVVEQDDDWLVLVPFWAVWPFETLFIPRAPASRLSDLDDRQRETLAGALTRLLARYDNLFASSFPYSMGWHQAPFDGQPQDHWQLHAHFYPPLLRSPTIRKYMVGYELLAQPQRDLSAEDAADRLRAVSPVHYLRETAGSAG